MKLKPGISRRRQRFNAQQQALLLDQLAGSALTIGQFAQQHGVAVSTVHRWRRRQRLGQRPASTLFESMPLGQVLGTTSGWSAEVSLPNGTQLRWNHQLSAAAWREVLFHLRRPC